MSLYSAVPLTNEERAANNGATHRAVITADSLTETATNTAQTLKLIDLQAGDFIAKCWWRCKTFLKDVSDAAFNTTTMSVGNVAAVDTHIDAIETNVNGTEVKEGISNVQVGPYTSADKVAVTFNSMSGKALNDIDTGEVHVFFTLVRPSVLEAASSAAPITTK